MQKTFLAIAIIATFSMTGCAGKPKLAQVQDGTKKPVNSAEKIEALNAEFLSKQR